MKILVFGDIVWRIWRSAFKENINSLISKYSADFVIVNWENLTSWRWPIEKHIREMENYNIDLFTWWNHSFDNESKISDYMNLEDSKLIRPANFYETDLYKIPWKGYKILEKRWNKLLVINLMSSVMMRDQMYNPFLKINEIIEEVWRDNVDAIVVDFHRETTSEICAMWFHLDWIASLVYWTHTHLQTNDEMILDNWTWLIWDVWMTWSMYSVIWAEFESVKKRFLTGIQKWKIDQSLDSRYVLNWLFVEIEDKKCIDIEKIRIRWKI